MLPLRPNPTDSNFVLTELRDLIEMQRGGFIWSPRLFCNRGKVWLTLNVIRGEDINIFQAGSQHDFPSECTGVKATGAV